MGLALPPEGAFVRSDQKGTRYWQMRRQGGTVETGSAASLDKVKLRSKVLADDHAAKKHCEKVRTKKLREGFVFVRDPAAAGVGEVVSRVALRHAQPHDFFDVHPAGRRLLVASEERPTNEHAWLHAVDIDRATTAQIFDTDGGSHPQAFSHCALFLGTDAALFAVNGQTWSVDLTTGEAEVAAAYQQLGHDAHFNDHCVWPSRDAAYQRALIFDRGDRLRVIDRSGSDLFDVSVASETHECRSGAISPSGGHVVAYLASRYIVYGHEDARSDATHEVRVWRVDSGELVHTVPMTFKLGRVGLSPDDGQLIALREYYQGPVFFDLRSGRQVRFFDDPQRDDRWATCRTWAYSADGTRLALAGHGVRVVDATRFEDVIRLRDEESIFQQPRRMVFSADGTILYVAFGGGEIVGWKIAD